MLAAAPAAAVRAPTRPPALVPRGCARRGGSARGGFGSRPVARASPRPVARVVRFARTPALASRDRIAGSAVRALDPRRRSARPSSSSSATPIFASAAVEVDEREDADASDLDVFDEPTVSIPISFFSILNVTPARASPAAIEAAYAGVINRELVDGFSDGCLAARADLVDAAAQVLSDPDLRRGAADRRCHPVVKIGQQAPCVIARLMVVDPLRFYIGLVLDLPPGRRPAAVADLRRDQPRGDLRRGIKMLHRRRAALVGNAR